MTSRSDLLTSLRHCATRIRRFAVLMGEVQGQGYVGQALGWADVLAVAYGHAMKFRPAEPEWEGRDRFLLSHGHYAIAHYAALIEAGVIPESELETYGSDDSRLPMSGMASYTPGMEISGGSLGQGLAIGVGMALALKHKRNPAFVYNSMSDGELDEGSTWEAAMGAAHHRLDNLICLVDINNQQADGPPGKVLGFEPLADKWAAFGWHVQRVDGNDLPAVLKAFDAARALAEPGNATVPHLNVTGHGVRLVDGGIRAATAEGVATLTAEQLAAAAAEGNPATGSPVAGLAEVRSVRPDAPAGLLRADIGGIAEIGVTPGVTNGQLTLTPQQTSLLGFPLPDGLFSGITATVDSTVESLPDGVLITDARVVDDGLDVDLVGRDVVLR